MFSRQCRYQIVPLWFFSRVFDCPEIESLAMNIFKYSISVYFAVLFFSPSLFSLCPLLFFSLFPSLSLLRSFPRSFPSSLFPLSLSRTFLSLSPSLSPSLSTSFSLSRSYSLSIPLTPSPSLIYALATLEEIWPDLITRQANQ